jgi:hypothetical protein
MKLAMAKWMDVEMFLDVFEQIWFTVHVLFFVANFHKANTKTNLLQNV